MARLETIPPVPTLAQLREGAGSWLWVYCVRCGCHHSAPMPLALPIILNGANASSDALRCKVRCTKCGALGALTSHPGICLGSPGRRGQSTAWRRIILSRAVEKARCAHGAPDLRASSSPPSPPAVFHSAAFPDGFLACR